MRRDPSSATQLADQLIDLAADRTRAFGLTPVSRETAERLDRFVTVLFDWQRRMNLIAASTEPVVWTRHIADSLQLVPLAPDARNWVDLGSGAGFPGLIIACALAAEAGSRMHLIESNSKKAAFLREAVDETGAPAIVHAGRIEEVLKNPSASGIDGVDVVTARALAPLPDLLATAYPLLKRGVIGLFPKGQDVDIELTEAAKCWTIEASLIPSQTDARARIVRVTGIERVVQRMRDSRRSRPRAKSQRTNRSKH